MNLHALYSVTTWLFSEKEYKLAAFFAQKGKKMFKEESPLFQKTLDMIARIDPNVCLSKKYLQDPDVLKKLFNSENTSSTSSDPQIQTVEQNTDEETLIKRLCFCFKNQKWSVALTCLNLLSQKESGRTNKFLYDFCKARVYSNMGGTTNLSKCIETLEKIIRDGKPYFLEAFFGLAEAQVKQKDLSAAEATIKQGLEADSKSQCIGFIWPDELGKFFPESNVEVLETMMRKQLSIINTMRIPVATCRSSIC